MSHPFQSHSPFPSLSLATAWIEGTLSVSISFLLGEIQWFLVTPETSLLSIHSAFTLLGDEVSRRWNEKATLNQDFKFLPIQQYIVIKPWA